MLEIIKNLEYKKAAINMRHQFAASDVNKELNTSEFNISVDEEPVTPGKSRPKTEVGQHMSKILADFDDDDAEEIIKAKGNNDLRQRK